MARGKTKATPSPGVPSPRSRLMKRIQDVLPTLSANDRRLADHLMGRFPRSAWETVETVSRDVGVSKAAVIRFAARLGYDGFGELQRELQEELAEIFASPLTLLQSMTIGEGNEALEDFRQQISRNLSVKPEQETLDTIAGLPQRILKCSGRILVIGASRSFGVAHYLHYALSLLTSRATLLPVDPSSLNTALLDVTKDDIVLAICMRRYATIVIKALEHCLKRGAYCVTFTDSLLGPPRAVSSHLIVVPTTSGSFLDSSVVTLFYIEALVAMIASRCKEQLSPRLADLLRIGREFGTFEDSRA
jgi:DNA-binding MurR/RpiR family transcriptional regulator